VLVFIDSWMLAVGDKGKKENDKEKWKKQKKKGSGM
jgi:hypothetical protein